MQVRPFRFSYINAKSRALRSAMLSRDIFQEMAGSRTVGDLTDFLKKTDYRKFIDEKNLYHSLDRYFSSFLSEISSKLNKKEKNFFYIFFIERKKIIEKKLSLKKEHNYQFLYRKKDLQFVKNLKDAMNNLPFSDRKDIKGIVGSYFDLINLITVLKMRIIYNLPVEDIMPFVIPSGYRLKMKDFIELSSFRSISQFSDYLSNKLGIKFEDFTSFRKKIYGYHIKQINRVWIGYPFKFSVPFGTARLKEIELMNIKTVYEGVRYRIGQKEIERMLVGVGDDLS